MELENTMISTWLKSPPAAGSSSDGRLTKDVLAGEGPRPADPNFLKGPMADILVSSS